MESLIFGLSLAVGLFVLARSERRQAGVRDTVRVELETVQDVERN